MRICHFRAQNIVLNKFFFGTNHYYYFHLPTGPFHCAKFKKFFTANPGLRKCTIFGSFQMVHLPQTTFFLKIIDIILTYLLAPFIVKKFFQWIQSYEDANVWAQNGPK